MEDFQTKIRLYNQLHTVVNEKLQELNNEEGDRLVEM